jgi:hypothetical protein
MPCRKHDRNLQKKEREKRMFKFATIGHAMAHFAQEIVTVSKKLAPIVAKLQGSEATVEALTSVIDPQAVPIERAAYAALGKLLAAVDGAKAAAAAGGLNIQLDEAEYNAFYELATYLKGVVNARQIAVPAVK